MINKNKKIKKISYSFVIADLFHYGHLRVLKMAKKSADYHICAALTDDICEKWHSKNICTLNERKKVLSSQNKMNEKKSCHHRIKRMKKSPAIAE